MIVTVSKLVDGAILEVTALVSLKNPKVKRDYKHSNHAPDNNKRVTFK